MLIDIAVVGFLLMHCTIICFMTHFDNRLNHVIASVINFVVHFKNEFLVKSVQ